MWTPTGGRQGDLEAHVLYDPSGDPVIVRETGVFVDGDEPANEVRVRAQGGLKSEVVGDKAAAVLQGEVRPRRSGCVFEGVGLAMS